MNLPLKTWRTGSTPFADRLVPEALGSRERVFSRRASGPVQAGPSDKIRKFLLFFYSDYAIIQITREKEVAFIEEKEKTLTGNG